MFYAVKNGRIPGIYNTWEECKNNVEKFSGAKFHKFKTIKEAEMYLSENEEKINMEHNDAENYILYPCAFIDGSFNPKTGEYGFGILFKEKEDTEEIYHGCDNKYNIMRNVAGECLASIRAIKLAEDKHLPVIHIYYDYLGIEKWITGEWLAKTPGTIDYKEKVCDLLKRNNIKVYFHKVEAHTGIPGNEKADELAKLGCGIF